MALLIAPAVHATAPVGATPGSFAVSPNGAATYSIPIFVPPGTNGMQPQLSLNYNSQGGNGLLGVGWSIGGLSVIHRCGSTIVIDGIKGGVNYDANDKYCLDGERLIWDTTGGFYRTQHESWQKVSVVGSYFTVTTKDGTVMTYGGTTDSQILALGKPSTVRIWALNRIQNLNGNYLTITYQNNGLSIGEYYPVSIAYTGNGSVAPYNFVYFDYTARSDTVSAYEGGSLITVSKRLTGIRTCIDFSCTQGSTLVRKHVLTYDTDGSYHGRSRLIRLQECGTDGVCLPATTFAWQNGYDWFNGGSAINIGTGVSPSTAWFLLADVNGDGRADAVLYNPTSGNVTVFRANSDGSFATGVSTNIGVGVSPSTAWFDLADVDGDGQADAVVYNPASGLVRAYLSNGDGSFTYRGSSYLIVPGVSPTNAWFEMADVNGDGLADVVLYNPASGSSAGYVFVLPSNGDGSFDQVGSTYLATGVSPTNAWFLLGDVNGDGRADAVLFNPTTGYATVCLGNGGAAFASGIQSYLGTGGSPATRWLTLADVNGDGRMDALSLTGSTATVFFGTGSGALAGGASTYLEAGSPSSSWFTMADISGNGRSDAIAFNPIYWMGYASISYASSDATFVDSNLIYIDDWNVPSYSWFVVGDVDGDGKADMVYYNPDSGNLYSFAASGSFPDLLTSVTTGTGVQTTVTYKPLTDGSVYTKGSGAAYPYQDVQNAAYVVSQSTQSDGIGGSNTTSYLYSGLKLHHEAAASLGFRWIQTTDPAGLVHITNYNQTLDCTEGMVASSETWVNGVRVKYAANTWTPVNLGGGRCHSRLAGSVEETRELNNSVVSTVNTSYSGYDSYGNPGTVMVDFNDGWSKTTLNSYDNDTVNWQLGRLTYAKVTATAPGQGSEYRESSFTYDSLGRVLTEVIEPNRSTLTLATTYSYDSFGNRTSKTLSGPDITTRTIEILTYDARGQFVTTRKNASNHTETYTYDLRTGAVATVTDANNITTTYTYNDGFGRKTRESRPGSPTTDIYYLCWDGSVPASGVKCPTPTGPAITALRTVTTGAGENYVYSDIFGRTVQTNTQGFSGNWIYKTTEYDSLGRVSRVSHPYFSGETVHYTTYTYYADPLGRLWKVTEPGPGNRTTTTAYNGLTITVTSPLTAASPGGQIKTTVKNSQGLVATAADNAGTTTYTYDPFGNLIRVAKSYDVGADIVMGYDERGRKKTMNDPDMGAWTYGYNVLGELTSQIDAKGQYMYMGYDKLGRLSYRTTPDTISSWTYDTAALGTTGRAALGKLAAVYGNSATETYAYDNLARVSAETASIGGIAYTTSYTYDANSRPLTLAYPETGFTLYHVYDAYGYLTEVHRDSATGTRFWQATGVDARGRLTGASLADGAMTTVNGYYVDTGDPYYSYTTGPNNSLLRYTTYNWDALDNLTWRMWYTGSTYVAENFGYDNLNRLTSVSGPSPKTYAYYPNGNIQSKSDVGTYTYPTNGTRPHAVLSVAGALNTGYTYDGNGNMLSGNGRTITYTSFNKPKTIAKGGITTTLTYDANFNRLIKSNSSGTTIYIGKLYERLTGGSTVTQKHYIYAGPNLVGAYTKVGTSTNTRYFHTDHLGSVDAITNETGGVVQRLSYDAWGKRRNPNGTDATSITAQTTRGFTRHEHDDEVGLVNMNAREYDYVIGRFVSPDTIVPGALNSQSYNRYSYVNNNPLSYTDPTGHFLHKKIKKAFKRVTKWGERVAHQFKEQVARSTTYALQKVSGVNYVGGLLSTGLLAGTQFGYAYGGSTGDWRTVGRAHATGAVLAASWWAGGALYSNYGGLTFVAGSYGIGYTAGYSISSIYGASSAQARDAASRGGNAGAGMALLYLGWNAMSNYVNAGARSSGNTSECAAGPCTAGSRTTAYDANGNPQPIKSATGFATQGMGSETLADLGHPELRAPHSWDWIPGAKEGVEFVSKVHDFGNSFTYVNGFYQPSTSGLVNDLFNVYSMSTMLPSAAYTTCAFGCLYFELNNQIGGP